MKTRIIASFAALAALVIAGVSCNKADLAGQVTNDGPKTYTLSINATRDGESTKGLGSDYSVIWATGERVSVYNITKKELLGYLSPSTFGTAFTILTGTVTSASGIDVDDELRLVWCAARETDGAISYDNQPGTLAGIGASTTGFYYEAATVTATAAAAAGAGDVAPSFTDASFKSQQSVATFAFSLTGKTITPSSIRVFAPGMNHHVDANGTPVEGFINVTPGGTATTIAMSINGADGNKDQAFTFYVTFGDIIYKGTTTCKLAHNKYYGRTTPVSIDLTEYMAVPSTATIDGVKWADRNIGASSPSAYGEHFAFGGLVPSKGTEAENTFTGTIIEPYHDVAKFVLGSGWRMPTMSDLEKLRYASWSSWDDTNKGFTVGGSIFLPAAGDWFDGSNGGASRVGLYGSSTITNGDASRRWYLYFNEASQGMGFNLRYYSLSVRPVSE